MTASRGTVTTTKVSNLTKLNFGLICLNFLKPPRYLKRKFLEYDLGFFFLRCVAIRARINLKGFICGK